MRVSPWMVGVVTPLLVTAAAVAAPLDAQSSLPIGSTTATQVPNGGAAELEYEAAGPGFLTVVVRSTAGEDVTFAITDTEYQALPEGESDIDLGGDVGAEQAVVAIPYGGTYRVVIETFGGGGASVQVGGVFLPSELAASDPDPDGRPSSALDLAVGVTHDDAIEPLAGDLWDWFRLPIEDGGVLTVFTRAAEGDLRLELYQDGAYREPINSSDQDIDGVFGNESLTWDVSAGSTIYLRVAPAFGGGDRIDYRIGSGVIPG